MQKIVSIFLIVFCFSLFACEEPLDQTLLHGTWQADQFLESGKPKNLDISNMAFTFNGQNVYTYQSNLRHREAGNYRIEGDILYSTDTLIETKIEKAVRIIQLTNDSLQLSMNNGGVKQHIHLHKAK